MNKSFKIETIQSNHDFKSLKNQFKHFEGKVSHANLNSSYDWLSTWWEVFENENNNKLGFNKKLNIICLFDNDELVAMAPFIKVYRRFAGSKVSFIEFLGQQWAGNYLDILCKKENPFYIETIFEWLRFNVKYDVILLKYIPENTTTFNTKNLYLFSACPEILLTEYASHSQFVKNNYSKSLKQNIRTANNKAKKLGIDLKTCIENIDEINFKEIITISNSKLSDGKSSMYNDENKLKFMQLITKKMTSNAVFVKHNGKNVAYRTNIIFNKNKFCIDASYDRKYRKFDLGSLSVDANLNDSISKKLDIHCLGPGLDHYKKKFTKKNTKIYMYIEKGNTIRSFFIFQIIKHLVLRKSKTFQTQLNVQ